MENCVARTNWFTVKDADKLTQALSKLIIADGTKPQMFSRTEDGIQQYAFGSKSEIKGYEVEEEDVDIYPFIEELAEIVAENDAIILQEVRHDKLRYVAAGAYVITSGGWDFIDFSDCVYKKACEMTGNSEFRTQLEY